MPTTHQDLDTPCAVVACSDVPEGGRYVIAIAEQRRIGLFPFHSKLYAYDNTCPHEGGPVCQGRLINEVRQRIDDQQRSLELAFDTDDPHLVCPWRGFEFRITTGEHPGAPSIRLRSFAVAEGGGEISVVL